MFLQLHLTVPGLRKWLQKSLGSMRILRRKMQVTFLSDLEDGVHLIHGSEYLFYGMKFQKPSQGTHFFQNITSLGVGYLTIDTVRGDGYIDETLLSRLECVSDGEFVKLYKAPESMVGFIDRSSNRAIVGF